MVTLFRKARGSFGRKHSALALGDESRRIRSRGWVLLTAIVLTPLSFFAGLQPASAGQKALLIAAGEYPYLGKDWQLSGPRKDVRLMSTFLVNEWGFSESDVRVIQDPDATKQGILDGIRDWLPRNTMPGDRVVIYFSGHGAQVDDVSGDERDGKDETFVPTDYGRNSKCARVPVAVDDLAECAKDMVLDDELGNAMRPLNDRVVILIADSCNSGTVTKGLRVDALNAKARYFPFPTLSKGITRDEESISNDVNVQLTISAALPHQLAWESRGTGVFTKLFIEALTDKRADFNNNKDVTTAELINYVKPRTEKWCDEVPKCREKRLGFTPNIDPKNETFVLQPLAGDGLETVAQDHPGAISDILPMLEDETIDIVIQPSNRLNIGEKLSIRLTSTQDGHLTLFDLNSENELTLLFPTRDDLKEGISDKIWAHRPFVVPDKVHGFKFTAGKPIGPGQAIAIVTNDQIDFSHLLDRYRNYNAIGNNVGLMKSISAHLYGVWTDNGENRGAQWAVGYADYEISAR